MDDELLTTEEVAQILKRSKKTVIRRIEEGKLTGSFKECREYRIPRSSVDKYLEIIRNKAFA